MVFKSNDIDFLGIDRVIRRGTGEVIENGERALFVRDSVSKAYFLACTDAEYAASLLDKYKEKINLLSVTNGTVGKAAFEMLGFSDKLECYQTAYFGVRPDTKLHITVRVAEEHDLPMLTATYHLISAEEMEKVVERGSLLLGYEGERLIGFIGEHLEGSMGLLYVFPEHRRRGFATELERIYIARTIDRGFIPFGQVEKSNEASLILQKKLGMTISENLIWWMWK